MLEIFVLEVLLDILFMGLDRTQTGPNAKSDLLRRDHSCDEGSLRIIAAVIRVIARRLENTTVEAVQSS